MCGAVSFAANGHVILELVNEVGGPMILGGRRDVLPCAAVVCQNCGFTMLLNLVFAGVLPSRAGDDG
jgi:hypothetical protein